MPELKKGTRSKIIKKIFFPLFIILLLLICNMDYAIDRGEIKGRVQEENEEGLPGVEITAKSPHLQGLRTTVSLKNGDFHFPLLPVGEYTLTFNLPGFSTVVQENVIVRLGRVTDLTLTMHPSKISEEITVSAAVPLIDKTSTDTSYIITSEDLEAMPVQNRTVVDAIKFTPGVTGVRVNTRRGTAKQGQPSFRGEGEEGNTWVLDGLSMSGVRLKNSGMHLNFDCIDEIQVISDPFSPEYGPAFGGIINMVTKSGGNDFFGDVALIFTNKSLQAERNEQLAIVTEPLKFSNYNLFFNMGGPLAKDKLWFFISNNLFLDTENTRDATIDYYSVPGGEKTERNNNLLAKLSYAINNSHHLSLTSIYHKSLGQTGGTGVPELVERKDFADLLFRMNYKGILSPSSFIEAVLGYARRDSLIEPEDGDINPAQYYIEDLALNIRNSYGNVTDDQDRLDFSIKFTKYFETPYMGHHEISLGFEYTQFSSTFNVDFTGKGEDIFPGNGFDSGTKYYFESWREGQKTPRYFYEYGDFSFINSAQGTGIYFKDKVTLGRFTLMAGLRTQTQVCFDDKDQKLWSWNFNDFLAPRLSLAVDLTGDGINILKLGWGRFSDYITTMPLGFFNSAAGLTFRTYRWKGSLNPRDDEIHDPANWQHEHEQQLQPFEVSERLQPNFLTRFLIEFDRKLGTDWAVAARYVRSDAADLLEVLAVFDPATQYKFLFDNFEHKKRNYRGFELELSGKIGSWLFLNTSYSYATAKGTNPGQTETGSWSQEEGSTTFLGLFGNHIDIPNIPGLEDVKEYWDEQLGGLGGRGIGDEGWYGKLPYSVDHNFKLNAILFAPYGLILSSAFEYVSGYHWEKLGYVPFFGGYYSYPETRGTRKTPGHFYWDIGLEKEFALRNLRLSQDMILTVRLDMLNLMNSQKPISYVKEDIPIFGQVWARQQPRQARVMIKLKW